MPSDRPIDLVALDDLGTELRGEAAAALVEAFGNRPSGYHTFEVARDEVARFDVDHDRSGLAAVHNNELLGWIGWIAHSEHGWELHPLVVRESYRGTGIGTVLVEALESHARAAGVMTIWLGADDDFGGTNLFGQDLYPDVLGRLREVEATAGHPITFYRRLGYTVVGGLPDVSGPGMHDLLMAKRIAGPRGEAFSPGS